MNILMHFKVLCSWFCSINIKILYLLGSFPSSEIKVEWMNVKNGIGIKKKNINKKKELFPSSNNVFLNTQRKNLYLLLSSVLYIFLLYCMFKCRWHWKDKFDFNQYEYGSEYRRWLYMHHIESHESVRNDHWK